MSRIRPVCFAPLVLAATSLTPLSADVVWFDNFDDGSVRNIIPMDTAGRPIIWNSFLGFDPAPFEAANASSGEFVLTSTDGDSPVTSFVELPAGSLTTTSVRARTALEGSAVGLALLARTTGNGWYQAGYNADAERLYIAFNGAAPEFEPTTLVTLENTPFDLAANDLFLQFDVVGDLLSLTAWEPGQPVPSEPQLTYLDNDSMFPQGGQGVILDPNSPGVPSSATFRYVVVADSRIPEPTAAALVGLSLLGSAPTRRRRR